MSDPEKQEMLYVNPAYEAIWGRSVESLYAEPTSFLDAVHDDDRERVEAAIADQASGTYEEEYRIVRPDGEVRWVWDRAIPVENDAGEVYRIVGVAADITDRKVREREHQTTIDFLQELYETATATDLSAEEKITRLLTAGPELLGLPPGYLTRITRAEPGEADGTQRIIEASGDHDLLQPGNTCPLSQSYCRNTIDLDGVLEVPDAEAAGWAGDPAYELFNLGCYIGTDITVNGELYGTVFFAKEAPRGEPFTDAERTFVRLLSQLVRYELEANDARQVLES